MYYLSYVPVSFSQLRNIAAPFLERLAIPRITLILAPFQTIKQFLLLSKVFYLPPPSNINKGQRKGGGWGRRLSRNVDYGLLRDSSSLTTASCPFPAAHDSGVRRPRS